jgi:hypothetical protein
VGARPRDRAVAHAPAAGGFRFQGHADARYAFMAAGWRCGVARALSRQRPP